VRDTGIRFAENFLWAGSSALLISLAHLYPQYWFIALFALIPFLWGIVGRVPNLPQSRRSGSEPLPVAGGVTRHLHVSKPSFSDGFRPTNALVLGIMLATCYAIVAYPSELWLNPGAFLLKLLALNLIFIAFGIAVNLFKKHIGFNVIFIAALWLPLEYALSHIAGLENLFTFAADKSNLLVRIGSLFGLLMISFVVVLVNSLLLILFKHAVEALQEKSTFPVKEAKRIYLPFKEIFLERRWYYFPDRRAPPICRTT
jgi:hypothetical protein